MSAQAGAKLASQLSGGDRRSIGEANAVAALVHAEPACFAELWACLTAEHPVVRMRGADALEKLSRTAPHLFTPHKMALLSGEPDDGMPELRWHLIAIASRLAMSEAEAAAFASRCNQIIWHDGSRIVRVMALQAWFDVAGRHPALQTDLAATLHFALASALPSLRARAARLTRLSG